jgi:hypothetical protein
MGDENGQIAVSNPRSTSVTVKLTPEIHHFCVLKLLIYNA